MKRLLSRLISRLTANRKDDGSQRIIIARGSWDATREVITLLVIAVTAMISFYEYKSFQREQTVEKTFSYIDKFESGPVGESKQRITLALLSVNPAIEVYKQSGLTKEELDAPIEELHDYILNLSYNEAGITTDIDKVVSFLDQLAICVKEKLCDERSSYAFFGQYAQRLRSNFNDFISTRQANAPEYAIHLDQFLSSMPSGYHSR